MPLNPKPRPLCFGGLQQHRKPVQCFRLFSWSSLLFQRVRPSEYNILETRYVPKRFSRANPCLLAGTAIVWANAASDIWPPAQFPAEPRKLQMQYPKQFLRRLISTSFRSSSLPAEHGQCLLSAFPGFALIANAAHRPPRPSHHGPATN